VLYFVKDIQVNLAISSSIEGTVERIPQAIGGKIWMAIVVDGLDGGKFPFINPVHQLPQTATLIHNFLDFVVKKESLDVLDNLLEFLPVLETP